MNIVVCAKEVVNVSDIRIDPKTNKPMLQGLDRKISDIDKNAVEEAVRIREKLGGKITVLSVGPSEATETIKELLAMGADAAVVIPFQNTENYDAVSSILAGAIGKMESCDLVLCGEASIDLFSGQMGPRIAQKLGIPQMTYAKKVTAEEGKVTAERDLGDRQVTVESPYPALVTVTKEINEPRLPSLMEILGAAGKPVEVWAADTLAEADNLAPRVETVAVKGVPMERKNIVFDGELDDAVGKLVDSLAKDGVLG